MATPFDDIVSGISRERAGGNLYAVQSRDPDQVATANRVSRVLGLPADFVEPDLPAMKARADQITAGQVMARRPKVAAFMADPRAAALARDDLGPLGAISRTFSNLGSAVAEGVANTNAGLAGLAQNYVDLQKRYDVTAGLQRRLFGATIYDPFTRNLSKYATAQEAEAKRVRPVARNRVERDLLQGVASLPTTIASIGIGLAGAPAAGLALAGGVTAGQSYREGRAAGMGVERASIYGAAQGLIEAATEKLPLGQFLADTKVGTPFAKRLVKNLIGENIGEQAATALQDFNTFAAIDSNRGKTFAQYLAERPDAALSTLLSTTATVGGLNTATAAAEGAAKVASRVARSRAQAGQATSDAAMLDDLASGIADSKTAKRDPSALAQFLALHTTDTPGENVYVPAEQLRSYFQSNDIDWNDDNGGWNFIPDFASQMNDALVSGGDVVVPTSDFAAHLANTPAWDALKDHVRMTPGGMSLAEAQAYEADSEAAFEEMGRQYEAETAAEREATAPRDRLFESVRDKLTASGMTLDAAATNAALVTARYATRAERGGRALTGTEFDAVDVRQVLPPALAPIVAADSLDIAIETMRLGRSNRSDSAKFGPSLLEWIAKNGGIEDSGGDIASMGGNTWHRGKPGRRKLLRDEAQSSMLGATEGNTRTPDALALAAQEAGYLPMGERADISVLFDAIDAELRGTPRYAEDTTGTTDQMRAAADDLAQLLDQQGVDPDKASKADIKAAVTRYQSEQTRGRAYGQSVVDDVAAATPGRAVSTFREARAAAKNFQGQPLTNLSTGLTAVVSRGTLDKMLSAKAVAKSTSPADHSLAVANADKLFTNALLASRTDDARGEPTIASIQRYVAPMVAADGRVLAVKLTVKETRAAENANPLYTIETIDVESEARIGAIHPGEDQASAPDQDRNAAPPGFTHEIMERLENVQRSFDQSFASGPRGRITFPGDGFGTGPSVIELFQARDMSTFLHESGHQWLEELRQDAEAGDATDAVKADWQIVQDWFAVSGHPLVDGAIPVEAHELWARGIERYVMEGKSPSTGLRRVLDSFRGWMLSIYKVVSALRSPITPEIRGVMDRLLATDAEIADAAAEQNIKALFTDAAAAGMTDAEFAAYQRTTTEARDAAHDALLFRAMATIRRERTQAWRDEEFGVRNEVRERVDARPDIRVLTALRAKGSGLRLDRAWLIETYGQDALGLLPKGVPPIYAEAGGTDADILAEMHGFASGDEMVRALMGLEARKQELKANGNNDSARQSLIDEETAAIMSERHGDILSDGSIEQEAVAAIHNAQQGEVIASELRALSRKTTDESRPTPYSLARQWAERKIADSVVVDAVSGAAMQRYAKAAAKASRDAEAAILKGDADEAFRQKQAQMLNNALIAEATKAKERVDGAVARLGKLAKRATIKSIDQDYLDQVHGLLEQVDMRTRTQASIDRVISFEEWAVAQNDAGHDVVVPPSFASRIGTRNWSRLTVEELIGLDDTIKQIVHLGRLKQKLLDGQDERDFNAIVEEAVASAEALDQRAARNTFVDPTYWQSIKAGVASMDASLRKMEAVFDRLDGKDSNGVFNRVVFRRLADAQARKAAMMQDYVGRLTGLLEALPKEQIKRWSERVTIGELMDPATNMPFTTTRDRLISMALNMGNEGNARKLAGGYGWNEGAILDALNRELTEADWLYVQSVWDTIDGLRPESFAMERRINGVEPERVEPRSIETKAGLLAGGYFPVVYDPTKNYDSEANAAKQTDLFASTYTRATTRSGSLIERTQVQRPIHLSLGVINRHVAEVIHDITHREAVMDSYRLLSDRRVMKAVDETLGPEVRKQFRPWLQHIANEMAVDRAGLAGWDAFARKLRTNTSIVGMGFRLNTVLMQVAGYANTVEVIGARAMASGFAAMARAPVESYRFVMERSDEVRNRMDTMERDIQENLRRLAGKVDLASDVRRFAFHGIGYMDRVVVVPTWLGAYNKAVEAGMSEEDAGYAADKAVRQSQGAGAAKDLASVARSNEWMRLATMFYSYHSALFQRVRGLGEDVAGAARKRDTSALPGLLARSFWLLAVPPILSELIAGRGPDDDDDWGMWAFQKMILNLFGPIPLARDLAPIGMAKATGEKSFGYSFTPAARAFETGLAVVDDARHVADGKDTKRATRNAMEAAGYALGLPTGQLAASTQFIVNVANDEADPKTISDWYEGLSKGRMKED